MSFLSNHYKNQVKILEQRLELILLRYQLLEAFEYGLLNEEINPENFDKILQSADAILDKLQKVGMHQLSPEETSVLAQATEVRRTMAEIKDAQAQARRDAAVRKNRGQSSRKAEPVDRPGAAESAADYADLEGRTTAENTKRIAELRDQIAKAEAAGESTSALQKELGERLSGKGGGSKPRQAARTPESFARDLAAGRASSSADSQQYYENNKEAIEKELNKLYQETQSQTQNQGSGRQSPETVQKPQTEPKGPTIPPENANTRSSSSRTSSNSSSTRPPATTSATEVPSASATKNDLIGSKINKITGAAGPAVSAGLRTLGKQFQTPIANYPKEIAKTAGGAITGLFTLPGIAGIGGAMAAGEAMEKAADITGVEGLRNPYAKLPVEFGVGAATETAVSTLLPKGIKTIANPRMLGRGAATLASRIGLRRMLLSMGPAGLLALGALTAYDTGDAIANTEIDEKGTTVSDVLGKGAYTQSGGLVKGVLNKIAGNRWDAGWEDVNEKPIGTPGGSAELKAKYAAEDEEERKRQEELKAILGPSVDD